MKSGKIIRGFLAMTAASVMTCGVANAEIDEKKMEVIVGNHTDPFTTNITIPFFQEKLKDASGGKITSNTVPYTELGLSGFELMNLLKLGTNDISWGVPGYVAGDSPAVEGLELPGMSGDYNVAFKVQDAYRPIFDRELQNKFNAKLISYSQQPALQAFCKLSDDERKNFNLDTLKGKKIRVHSTSFADYAEALGAVPITMPFPDVIPALERGAIDCAITSPSAAYGYKFGQVITDVVDIPIGYSTHFYAMNLDSWNSLNEETQKLLTEQFAKLESDLRDYTPTVQKEAANCFAEGPCSLGEPAKRGLLKLNDEDTAKLKKRVEEIVLARWAERCGNDCAKEWNDSVSGILGMTMPAK